MYTQLKENYTISLKEIHDFASCRFPGAGLSFVLSKIYSKI